MRPLRSLAICAAMLLACLPGNAAEVSPTGPEILDMVRMSRAAQELRDLKGKLRISESDLDDRYNGSVYPFTLSTSDKLIRFEFADPPKETISLQLNKGNTTLYRATSAGKTELPASLYAERVRQTAINYEDLSMRFIHWPNAKVVGEEMMGIQKTWMVRVANPDSRGPYRLVDLWVGQKSRALLQMRAYDDRGRLLKQFKVRDIQSYKGGFILKKMRVDTYDPTSGRGMGVTYLELEDPD